MSPEFTQSITGCARCGCEGHKDLVWRRFIYPPPGPDGVRYSHFAPCPETGEPILMHQVDVTDEDEEQLDG